MSKLYDLTTILCLPSSILLY